MKKVTIVVVLVLIVLLGLLAVTNPSMDDFQNHVRQSILKESRRGDSPSMEQVFGSLLGGFAGSLIASQTVRTDYVFFSTYEVVLGVKRMRTIGVMKNFFVLENPR